MTIEVRAWPEKNETAIFSDISDPLRKLVNQFYTLRRKKLGPVSYKGYDIGDNLKACCLPVEDLLTPESIEYADQEQDRDPMETIISLAVQLGMEQGRRCQIKDGDREDLMKRFKALVERE